MSDRLPAGTLASALIRRTQVQGGFATLLARGDPDAGALLLLLVDRGASPRFVERGVNHHGKVALISAGPAVFDDPSEVTDYWRKRRHRDPDLWVIELDIPSAERFAAETLGVD